MILRRCLDGLQLLARGFGRRILVRVSTKAYQEERRGIPTSSAYETMLGSNSIFKASAWSVLPVQTCS